MSVLFGLATLFAATAHAEILNISVSAAYVAGETLESCTATDEEVFATNLNPDACILDIPLPIAYGRTIKQITVFYGSLSAGVSWFLTADLKYLDLAPSANSPTAIHQFSWNSSSNPGATMTSRNLMAQAGVSPWISYPDAFVVTAGRAYSVRVSVTDAAKFYGLRVTYD